MKTIEGVVAAGLVAGISLATAGRAENARTPTNEAPSQLQVSSNPIARIPLRASQLPAAGGLTNGIAAKVSRAPRIEITNGFAVGKFAPHQVMLAGNLNTTGAVDFLTPEGKRLRSRPAWLVFYEESTGKSVLLAEVKDRVGEVHPPNRVIYSDAFSGDLKATVIYTLTKNAFTQDLLILSRPPGPEEWGMSAAGVRLELWTECLDWPAPAKVSRAVAFRRASDGTVEKTATDESLDFGTMSMSEGRAFLVGSTGNRVESAVVKTFRRVDGHDFLIEGVDYLSVKAQLDSLPQVARSGGNRSSNLAVVAGAGRRAIFPIPEQRADTANPIQVASLPFSLPHGLLLDYTISNNIPTSGLKLWVKSDAGVTTNGTNVSLWADQSGNTNHFSQTNAAWQPAYVLDSFNGRPGIRFDGTNDQMDSILTLETNLMPSATLYTVERMRAAPATGNYRAVWSTDGTTGDYQRGRGFRGDDFELQLGYIDEEDETPPSWQPGLSAATNTVRIVGVTYTGSDTFLFINGTDYNAGKQNAGSGTEPLRIGAGHVSGGTSYQQSKVDFAEMLVYDRELSTDERTQLENYLNLRYNVFTNKLAAPRITPIGGDFTSAISVTVTSSVAGATYLVSMTGTGWSNYTGPITVTNSTTVFAQTTKSGEPWSDVTAQHFNFCLISNQAIPTNGLKLRLLADSGVVFDGDYVSRWRDQSGNTNDVTQLAIAYQPRYVTNSMNGKPAIRFDGANDWMDSLLTIPTNTFPTVTVYTVERIRATPGGYRSVWGVDGTTGNWQRGRGFWADDDPEREFVVQMGERGGDLEDNIWRPGLDAGVDAIRVVGLTYTPTNTFAFVNAASYTEGGHAFSNSMEYFRIGAGYIGGQNCAVDFSEILVYDHKLTDPERTQLESSLSLKYITDSDNDGLPDAWEVVHFGNITSYSGYNDPDGDWITNTQEYENGSNPMDTMVVAWGGNYLGQTDVPLGLREVVAVAGGYDFSLALRTDGRVSVWGGNEYGQTNPPSDLTNAVAIAAGFQHALALRQNGRVVQWGYSDYFSEAVPTNLVDAKAIAAGFAFSLALRSNGTLVAWGGPSNYAVIALPTNLTTVKAIAAAECHGLALLSNGTVVGWGIDPIIVPTNLTGVAAIATGFMHGLILRSNGTVMAFGDNSYNQTNMPVGLSDIAAIAAGELHSVVLRSNGTLVSWGDSTFGATNVPAGLSGVIGIGAGFAHNLAIRSGVLTPLILQQPSDQAAVAGSNVTFTAKAVGLAGVRYQWRFNAVDDIPGATNATLMLNNVQAEDEGYYRVFISTGAGTVISSSATFTLITPPTIMSLTQPDRQWLKYPAPVDLTLNVTATAPAEWASTLTYQWKLDGTNIVGGATSSNYSVTSFDSPEERQYSVAVANAAGTTNSTTLKLRSFRQGGVAAWGANESGQLNRPWAASNVISVAGGASHSLLLREDGTLLGWGDSSYGQTNVPAGITNVTSIAAGANHNLALLSDSTVLAWGRNNSDQTNVPAGLTNVVGVAAGGDQSFALLNNGTVTNWGASNAPMPSGLTNIMAIAVGTNFSLALRSNGTVVAWGNNGNGQTNVPSGLSNVVAIAGGGAHALALRQNGTVVAWGLNSAGQTNAPADLTNAMAVAGGYLHSVALRNDGTVVVWGDNSSGQTNVGNGLTGVKSVAAGGYHSLAAVFSPLVQYTVDVSKDVLLIYNTNSVDSSNVCAYYIQHRPMITGANVLPIGTHPQETVSRETFTNTIRNPILAWLDANPTKRPQYWVMFLDIPTRLNAFTNQIDTNYYVLGESVRDNSVSYELHANTTPIRPFITYINMADTNVCRGYIDKLESFGSNYSPAKLIISAHAGTYNNMNYYFDDAFGYVGPYRPGTNAMLGVIAAGAAQSNVVYVGASTHISYGTNVAGYLTWGGNAGQGGDYPTNGSVVFTGESGWWIIETVESYNGQRFRLNQGTFMRWFAANAFGGANFANTPAGAVCHVDEPGYSDVNDASLYFAYWHLSHRFAHCAWNSRQTPFFLAVGDPLITR